MPFSPLSTIRTGAVLLALGVSGCTSDGGLALFSEPLPARLEDHVAKIASDEAAGRGTGTKGYDVAAAYVAEFFAEHGVEPAARNYRQDVPLVAIDVDSIAGELSLSAGGETLDLTEGKNVAFYPPSDGVGEGYSASASGGIVFVGDGVVAPSLGLDAYDGVDVDGKIVMMFRGAPDIEDRATEVHVRRFDTKRAEAVRRGAVGVLYIDPEDRDVTRLATFRASHPDGALSVGGGFETAVPTAVVDLGTARKLFEASDRSLDDALGAMKEGKAKSFAMAATGALETSASAVPVEAYNVVGIVPGTNPALAREAVVVTAHLDHLGTHHDDDAEEGTEEDPIYNGALDNATGTAIIMEAAARLAERGGAERPVIFAAVTAEEAGLLGSAHLARTVDELGYEPIANVNIDMPVLTYPLNDIIGFGAGYSTLDAPLTAAAEEAGLVATPDPLPELSLFVRSDHYRFVQEGIPSLFLFNGMSGEGKAQFQEFMATHYHKPSDEVTLPINWQDAARFTDLTYGLVTRIANAEERPVWNEGVAFAPMRPKG